MSFLAAPGVIKGLGVAGTVLGVGSTLRGSRAQANAMRADARQIELEGNRDEESVRRDARKLLGMQAAAFAQAGGGIDAGVLRESAARGELDALNVRYRARSRAASLYRDADELKKQSRLLAGAQALSGLATTFG